MGNCIQGKERKMTKIICDSTCDLSKDLLKKYDISILPLHILLGDKEYSDGVDLTPEEIYKWAGTSSSASLSLRRCRPPQTLCAWPRRNWTRKTRSL